jgi:carbamoylphosphate synthase small subunit
VHSVHIQRGPRDYAIAAIREILDATRIPVFGICLGHQLMEKFH